MEAKPERLQKILAAAGLASRRKAEELIAAGMVSVNGHVITELGTKADPRLDEIRVDGKLLRGPERHVYLAMYKPKGYMTTVSDPEGRPTVMDVLKGVEERVFPIGRLDYMSEGLLLLTNDGDLMAQLTRAGSHVAKTYMVKVSGKPNDEALDKLRNGIMLPPEPGLAGARGKKQPGVERRSFAVLTQPAVIQLAVDQENPWFEVTLTEGRNRQLRRMFEQIGHHIEKIKRIRYGSLTLDLEPGEFRHLTPKEVNQLRKSLETPFKPKPIKVKRKGGRPGPAERTPRLDAARFVKGRRGKPSEEAAAVEPATAPRPSARKTEAAPAYGAAHRASPARRPFTARPERGPAHGFTAPRGPEFAREQRRDEGFAAKRRFPRKPEAEFGSKREGGRDIGRETGRETGRATDRNPRRTSPGASRGASSGASSGTKGFGFDRFAKPKFAKVSKRRDAGERGGDKSSGFGERESFGRGKAFGARTYSKERAAGNERGPAGPRSGFKAKPSGFAGKPSGSAGESGGFKGKPSGFSGKAGEFTRKPGGFSADRRFAKGPGKPERGESSGFGRRNVPGGDFKGGKFQGGERPGRGGEFKRPSRGGFQRPGGGSGGRSSSPARGGAPRPPRRRPEPE